MTYRIAPLAAAAALSAALALPAAAQDEENGRSLMERGGELFFEGLSKEVAPALEDMRAMAEQFGPSMQSFFEEMGPAFAGILEEVGDWSVYEPPEILPNGDIIIRRKPDPDTQKEPPAPEAPEADAPPPGSTDI